MTSEKRNGRRLISRTILVPSSEDTYQQLLLVLAKHIGAKIRWLEESQSYQVIQNAPGLKRVFKIDAVDIVRELNSYRK